MKIIPKKRRRQNKTNYLKRRKLLESNKPRIVIRKTNKYILLQYIESDTAQDKVKYTITSKELMKHGWPKEAQGSLKSLPACYLTGLLFGKKIAKEKPAILDTGLITSTKGSRLYAALKGIIDSGYKVKCKEEIFPKEDRIKNEKTKNFFEDIKNKILKQ